MGHRTESEPAEGISSMLYLLSPNGRWAFADSSDPACGKCRVGREVGWYEPEAFDQVWAVVNTEGRGSLPTLTMSVYHRVAPL